MKEFQFPRAIKVRINLDQSGVSRPNFAHDELAIIEKNGAAILSATVAIEELMIEAISGHLFHGENEKRHFFAGEVMGTSDFSFAAKRRVFGRLLEHFGLLRPEDIRRLKANLSNIMLWRNAFAHGQVMLDAHKGHVLQYYSGGHKELILDDSFFEKAENTFRECLHLCNGVIHSQSRSD